VDALLQHKHTISTALLALPKTEMMLRIRMTSSLLANSSVERCRTENLMPTIADWRFRIIAGIQLTQAYWENGL